MWHYIIMWIKWRYYERKGVGERDGEKKYRVQPILMITRRPKKATVIQQLVDTLDLNKNEVEEMYQQDKDFFQMPRQKQFYRFLPFLSCDYVHLYDPTHIENRVIYWQILDNWRNQYPGHDQDADKALNEIDTVLPRPDEKSLSILREAYSAGLPMHIQIKKYNLLEKGGEGDETMESQRGNPDS